MIKDSNAAAVSEAQIHLKSYQFQPNDRGWGELRWLHTPASIKHILTLLCVERDKRLGGWAFEPVISDEEFIVFKGRKDQADLQRHLNLQKLEGDDLLQHRLGMESTSNRLGYEFPNHLSLEFGHSLDEIESILRADKVSSEWFSTVFCTTKVYKDFLVRLSSFFRLYGGLSGATIAPKVLSNPSLNFWVLISLHSTQLVGPGILVRSPQPITSPETRKRKYFSLPLESAPMKCGRREGHQPGGDYTRMRDGSTPSSTSDRTTEGELRQGSSMLGKPAQDCLQLYFRIIATLESGQDLSLSDGTNKALIAKVSCHFG